MVKISKFGEDFLLLALRIGKHIKGYVDFYIGPENLKKLIENESLTSPNKLLNDSNALLKQLRTQSFNKERIRYVEKLLIAMKTSIEILQQRTHTICRKVINSNENLHRNFKRITNFS